jgi:hypothetical protein
MGYPDFSLKDVKQKFGITTTEDVDLFPSVPELPPDDRLRGLLRDYYPIAVAINTEKAKSELLIAPILTDIRIRLHNRVSLFSGTEFPVDPARGLGGYCDFILTRSPEQQFISAPVLVVVEAKNDNPKNGFGQCAAAMVGVQLFNEKEGTPLPAVYGAATTGTIWRFLKLEGGVLYLDKREYYIPEVSKILGILHHILTGSDAPAAAA